MIVYKAIMNKTKWMNFLRLIFGCRWMYYYNAKIYALLFDASLFKGVNIFAWTCKLLVFSAEYQHINIGEKNVYNFFPDKKFKWCSGLLTLSSVLFQISINANNHISIIFYIPHILSNLFAIHFDTSIYMFIEVN